MTVYTLDYNCWCNCSTADTTEEFSTLGEALTRFNWVKSYFGENFTLTLYKQDSTFDYSSQVTLLEKDFDTSVYCQKCTALETESDYLYSPPPPPALVRGPHPSEALASRW